LDLFTRLGRKARHDRVQLFTHLGGDKDIFDLAEVDLDRIIPRFFLRQRRLRMAHPHENCGGRPVRTGRVGLQSLSVAALMWGPVMQGQRGCRGQAIGASRQPNFGTLPPGFH
jgi:hypothetical protein